VGAVGKAVERTVGQDGIVEEGHPLYIKGHKLLEWSVVPIPSNPSAGRMPTRGAAQYDATVKSFLGITDSRALRLTPHRRGLDEVKLKAFLSQKSDLHYSQRCPRGARCPNAGPQLAACPAADCPVQPPERFELDRTTRAYLTEAMAKELRREAWAMSRSLIDDIVKPALRQHAMKVTGRLD
jgi:hypothetical protein